MKISIVYVLLDFALVCDLLLCEACLYDYLMSYCITHIPEVARYSSCVVYFNEADAQ